MLIALQENGKDLDSTGRLLSKSNGMLYDLKNISKNLTSLGERVNSFDQDDNPKRAEILQKQVGN